MAKAQPDGYTLIFTVQAPIVSAPFLMKQMPYDPLTAFAPVALIAEAPNVMLVHPGMPFRTVTEFIAYARTKPNELSYASQGQGTTGHITGAMINQLAGTKLVHVPYKGFPPMLADVKTGRVAMMFVDTINALPRIRSKELIAIAIAADRRSAVLPDVPTFAENGYADIVSGPWFAMFAPAGTPADIIKTLSVEVREALKLPAVAARLRDLGVEVKGSTPAELAQYMKADYQRWGEYIRAAGVTPE